MDADFQTIFMYPGTASFKLSFYLNHIPHTNDMYEYYQPNGPHLGSLRITA